MSNNKTTFSLEKFEQLVHSNQHELAARELLALLLQLDSGYGAWEKIGNAPSHDRIQEQADRHILARTSAAIGSLFAKSDFNISVDGWGQSLFYNRWIQILFGACDFYNTDHILHLIKSDQSKPNEMTLDDPGLIKFSLLYSGDSDIPLQINAIWNKNPQFAAGLALAILSSRVSISEPAAQKKEHLLEWLPKQIKGMDLIDAHLRFLHDVYMHCSYSHTPKKHDIKAALNPSLKKRLLSIGCQEIEQPPPLNQDKPTILLPLEWFTSNHSVYRCFSPAIRALGKKFRLVAMCTSNVIDDISRQIFDDVIEIKQQAVFDMVKEMSDKAIELKPDIVFYPSIGMQLITVCLATLRLAPIQLHTWGHPATTHSEAIDYFILEDGFINDPDCFSEKVIITPKGSMPFTLPENIQRLEPEIRSKPDTIKIAITASIMKLNPSFMKACREISDTAKTPIEFHFFVGHGIGVTRHYITNNIERYLKNTRVYPHSGYDDYIRNLNKCDLFLSPFPFGNTNGIVDAVRQGIPGVCLDGPELFSHIDGELFRRLSIPKSLNTMSTKEYINVAVKLIDQHTVRTKISKNILTIDPDQALLKGNPDMFCETMLWLHKNHEKLLNSDKSAVKPSFKRATKKTT